MTGRAPARATAPAARRASAGSDPSRDVPRRVPGDRDSLLRDVARDRAARDSRARDDLSLIHI